jgi:hypothetical protein
MYSTRVWDCRVTPLRLFSNTREIKRLHRDGGAMNGQLTSENHPDSLGPLFDSLLKDVC